MRFGFLCCTGRRGSRRRCGLGNKLCAIGIAAVYGMGRGRWAGPIGFKLIFRLPIILLRPRGG